jgi:hypothetical protein
MREAVDTLSQTEDFLLPWIVAESELKALAENHDALKDGEEEVLSSKQELLSTPEKLDIKLHDKNQI